MDQVDKKALQELDALSEKFGKYVTHDITVIVGVLAGIKPVAMTESNDDDREVGVDLLERLGLKYSSWEDKGLRYVSYRQDLADRMAELHRVVWGKNGEYPDENREIGRLLGYPETATEYFLRRLLTLTTDSPLPVVTPEEIDGTVSDDFCEFILSPDNYREEIETYVYPLEAANREYAPKTYSVLLALSSRS